MLGKNLLLSQLIQDPSLKEALGPWGNLHVDTIALSAICMSSVLVLGRIGLAQIGVEGSKGKIGALCEMLFNFVDDLVHGQIGHHYKKFFPLIAAMFFFIMAGNLIGIGPWKAFEHMSFWPKLADGEIFDLASPTTDFNVTLGLASLSFFTYILSGFWKHGLTYFKTLFGTAMAPIEIMDMIVRPSTLAIRLMVVITADELMRGAFLLVCPMVLPAGIMGFEVFIALIQAFVFALLSSIYIGLTVSEHH